MSKSVLIRYIAGKTYYFGVGGGMRQFENVVSKDGALGVERVWNSEQGSEEILAYNPMNVY